ncbi:hypothetical protein GQ457_02G030150 [Hibiscus cannabinus]
MKKPKTLRCLALTSDDRQHGYILGIDTQNREMRNLMYLKNARQHKAIEAWVSLSEKEMGFLERDAHFLAFASPNSYSDKKMEVHITSKQMVKPSSSELHLLKPFKLSILDQLGRMKNNLFITNFNEGVPYVEARVAGQLSDFIQKTEKLEAMNRLLPCPRFLYIQDPTTPQLAVQVNIFDCGGIALC